MSVRGERLPSCECAPEKYVHQVLLRLCSPCAYVSADQGESGDGPLDAALLASLEILQTNVSFKSPPGDRSRFTTLFSNVSQSSTSRCFDVPK